MSAQKIGQPSSYNLIPEAEDTTKCFSNNTSNRCSLVAATVVAATVVAATVVAVEEANFTKVVNLRQVVDVHPRVEAIIEAILNDELI